MPWFPIKGVVKKLRLQRGWTRHELAKQSGLTPRTIRYWESDKSWRTAHDDSVRGLAEALAVQPEEIADYLDHDPELDDLDVSGSAPPKSTLATRAARDELKEWASLPGGEQLELARPRLLHRLKTAPGLCVGARYVLVGRVRDHRDMPPIVAGVIGAQTIVCGKFMLARKLNNGDPFYASPFTTVAAHTSRLLDAAEAKEIVSVVVRVFTKDPDDVFKGFIEFQKAGERVKYHRWCFIIEDVLDGSLPVHYGEPGSPPPEDFQIKPKLKRRAKIPAARSKTVATPD